MSNFVKLTHQKLAVDEISKLVEDDACGAIAIFVGTTRNNFGDKKVLSLEYEAYEPMAKQQITAICDAIRKQWPDVANIAIHHRLGLVPIREASVVFAISSPHRQTALTALNFAVDELKKRVPIWKKERYDGEDYSWKENAESICNKPPVPLVTESIPKHFLQISAGEAEIQRRIQSFISKKREEIDHNNIVDYADQEALEKISNMETMGADEQYSCARTDIGINIKQKETKYHFKVHRVKNEFGPQVKPDYLHRIENFKAAPNTSNNSSSRDRASYSKCKSNVGFDKRLTNLKRHLHFDAADNMNAYEQLKALEQRVLYLESVSPEYRHFLTEKAITGVQITSGKAEQRQKQRCKNNVWTAARLEQAIEALKNE